MTMVLDANTHRVSRRAVLTFVAAVTVLFSVLSMFAPAARAAQTSNAARAGAAVAAWIPIILPIDFRKERVKRDLTNEQRDFVLRSCASGYLCVAAGQGDGRHTVWELWYCGERSLNSLIDAGAINNRQVGGVPARLLAINHEELDRVEANTQKDVDWFPVYYIDPC